MTFGRFLKVDIYAVWGPGVHRRWKRIWCHVSIFLSFCVLLVSILGFFDAVLFYVLGRWMCCRNIIPYIRKYGKNPVTGAPLKQEDLIPLTFHKNSEGMRRVLEWIPPLFGCEILSSKRFLEFRVNSRRPFWCWISQGWFTDQEDFASRSVTLLSSIHWFHIYRLVTICKAFLHGSFPDYAVDHLFIKLFFVLSIHGPDQFLPFLDMMQASISVQCWTKFLLSLPI